MKLRPAVVWFVPILLFGLSTFIWAALTGLVAYQGDLDVPAGYVGLRYIYLPVLASLLGLSAAVVAARVLWYSMLRKNLWALSVYALTFLSWGVVDIHYHNHQAFHCGISDGKSREDYWTWWFVPQDLVRWHGRL